MTMVHANELKAKCQADYQVLLKNISQYYPDVFCACYKQKIIESYSMIDVPVSTRDIIDTVRDYIDIPQNILHRVSPDVIDGFIDFLKEFGYEVSDYTERGTRYIGVLVYEPS
ncbi:hypothetical protein ASwh1_86 [Aeromonas phage Aswh_1]|nr:hypothetical protein ASwh1_86 [Aeromonas phage Aswh_1]